MVSNAKPDASMSAIRFVGLVCIIFAVVVGAVVFHASTPATPDEITAAVVSMRKAGITTDEIQQLIFTRINDEGYLSRDKLRDIQTRVRIAGNKKLVVDAVGAGLIVHSGVSAAAN